MTDHRLDTDEDFPEVSIVMPCLNEADTLATCISPAERALSEQHIAGEIIIADNGSTDGSQDITTKLNARLVNVRERGYGSALMGGIDAARGKFIVMGDADASYDFSEIPKFVEKLRRGFDFVQGCRLRSGGGHIVDGAMPWLHRVWGNPMFSFLARWWFQSPLHDVYCGMRAFRKDTYYILDQRCTGMEFATEMIIKASLYKARIAEVPITLHPDGRQHHAPHLRTFRDGWRTIRLFFICTPRWLFLVPGLLLIFLGMAGYAIAMPALTLKGVTFNAHTLLFASLAILCGYQSVVFAIFTKTFAISEGLLPEDPRMNRFFKLVTLERGLALAVLVFIAGLALLVAALDNWQRANFGPLVYAETMRLVIPGATLTADWPRAAEIVELFCGRGNGLHTLSRLGFTRLEGVDLSAALAARYQGPAKLYVGDCRSLAFDNGSKDIVIVQGGLHHLKKLPDDLEQTLSEAARVLRVDGRFVAVEPWLTPFLVFVHWVCQSRIARRMVPMIDALATMIDHERDTYEQWLGQPQIIVRLLERFFFTESSSSRWGKYVYVGRKRTHTG